MMPDDLTPYTYCLHIVREYAIFAMFIFFRGICHVTILPRCAGC